VAELGAVLGGRYRLERILGYGGMSTIFAATDGKLGRAVAVKVLRPEATRACPLADRSRQIMNSDAAAVQQMIYGGIETRASAHLRQNWGGDTDERSTFVCDLQDRTRPVRKHPTLRRPGQ
jgi:hypothetical protein